MVCKEILEGGQKSNHIIVAPKHSQQSYKEHIPNRIEGNII
jgi:hypothetical protein